MARVNDSSTRAIPFLQKTIYALLFSLALLLPVSIGLSSFVFFVLLGLYVFGARWTWRVWPPRWDGLLTFFGIFWGFSVLSAAVNGFTDRSQLRLQKDLYVVLLPLLGALLARPWIDRDRLFRFFLWGGLVTGIFGILQTIIGIDQSELTGWAFINLPNWLSQAPKNFLEHISLNDGRATGFRSHPLTFGETLLFPIAFLLASLREIKRGGLPRWFLLLALLCVALLFSKSRGPWIAFAVMALSLVALDPKPHLWRVLGIVLTLPIVLVSFVPQLRARAASITDLKFLSNSERLIMWEAGGRMLRDHPWLGVGPGNVKHVSPRYQSPEVNQAFGAWGHLHNSYVTVAAERGVVGFGAFSVFFCALWLRLWRAFRSNKETRLLTLTALLSFVGWAVAGVTEAVFHNTAIMMMFYFVVGVALATEEPEASVTDGKSRA